MNVVPIMKCMICSITFQMYQDYMKSKNCYMVKKYNFVQLKIVNIYIYSYGNWFQIWYKKCAISLVCVLLIVYVSCDSEQHHILLIVIIMYSMLCCGSLILHKWATTFQCQFLVNFANFRKLISPNRLFHKQ